jgi:hypothetical protein
LNRCIARAEVLGLYDTGADAFEFFPTNQEGAPA